MSAGFDISTPPGASGRNSHRLRGGVIAALGVLCLGSYLMIFRPITAKVTALEADLERTHRQISETGFGYPENPGEYLQDAEAKLARMQQLTDRLSERTAFHAEVEELLNARFRVLEFEQRRFDIRQNLRQLAEERGSNLPADLFAGLPSYHTTTERQQLLWLHLEFFNHVLEALLSSGRELRIERIESLPIRMLGETPQEEDSLLGLQLHLKARGPAHSLAAFLNGSLPGGGSSEDSMGKKAYSIDRLNLTRTADGENGQVILDTRLSGFILINQPL